MTAVRSATTNFSMQCPLFPGKIPSPQMSTRSPALLQVHASRRLDLMQFFRASMNEDHLADVLHMTVLEIVFLTAHLVGGVGSWEWEFGNVGRLLICSWT
jgi:hypothetical protein